MLLLVVRISIFNCKFIDSTNSDCTMHTKFGVRFRSNWISKRKILRHTHTPASRRLLIFVNTTTVNILENDSIWKRFCQNSFNKFNCYVFICQFIHLIPLKFADILKFFSSFELEKAVKLSFLLFVVSFARSVGWSLARSLAYLFVVTATAVESFVKFARIDNPLKTLSNKMNLCSVLKMYC